MSASSVCSSAERKTVKSKFPMAVDQTRSSAGCEMLASALPTAASELPPSPTTVWSGRVGVAGVRRIGSADERVVEGRLAAQVVLQAEFVEAGAVDEDDLGLDRHLRRPDIEAAGEGRDVLDPAPRVGDDERVGRGVREDLAPALGQDAVEVLRHFLGAGVVHPHHDRLQRFERVEGRQRGRRVDADDAAGKLGGGQPLRGEDGIERLGPRLVLDLGRHLALDVAAEDDRAAAEGGEACHHVGDRRVVPRHGDAGLVARGRRLVGGGGHFGGPGGTRRGGARRRRGELAGGRAGPGQEGPLGAERNPDLVGVLVDGVVLDRVQLDHHAHGLR